MKVTEVFLVNTNNFDSILESLRNTDTIPEKLTDTYFKSLGYTNPSDLLVLHLIKELGFINEDDEPTPLFHELREKDTHRMAMARGIINAYGPMFERNPQIHKLTNEELKNEFLLVFQEQKTDLILKYMAGTLEKLISYAGSKHMDALLNEMKSEPAGNGVLSGFGPESSQGPAARQPAPELSGVKSNTGPSATASLPETPLPPVEKPANKTGEMPKIMIPDLVGESKNGKTNPAREQPEDKPLHRTNRENYKEVEPEKASEFSYEDLIDNFQEPSNGSAEKQPENVTEDPMNAQPKPTPTMKIEGSDRIQKAVIKRADLLFKLGRYNELLPDLEHIILTFENTSDPSLRDYVSESIVRRANILIKLERYDDALPALDDVIRRFEHSGNSDFYNKASGAMLHKFRLMDMLGTDDNFLLLADKIIDRLASSTNPTISDQVDKVIIKKVDLLTEHGAPEQRLEAIDQAVPRFENNSEKATYLEEIMYRKAEILEDLGKDEEALDAYNHFIDMYGKQEVLN